MTKDERHRRGDRVGRYVVESHIGSGGFANVYLVVDEETNERLAMKLISSAMSRDPQIRRRVQREADVARHLRHPSIVSLRDSGTAADGRLYLAFDYVAGQDLSAVLNERGQLPAGEVREILTQLLDALSHAHQAGILHRDIKPENIRVLRTAEGGFQMRLLDFGIARPTDQGAPSITATGELLGTPRYMSPEQLTEGVLDARSDLYSLGIVALELLLGRDALHGNAFGDQIDRLRSGHVFAVEGQDTDLIAAITQMTARRPQDRFGSARAVRTALQGQPARTPADRERRPRPWEWVAVGVGVGAVICLLVILLVPDDRAVVAGDRATSPITDTQPAPVVTKRVNPPAPTQKRKPTPAPTLTDGCNLEPAGVMNGYGVVLTPQNYDNTRRHPLVLILRDYDNPDVLDEQAEIPRMLLRHGGFKEAADAHGTIFVAVVGHKFHHWSRDKEGSLAKLTNTARRTIVDYCIDRSRIYVLGTGHGGTVAVDALCLPWVGGVATFAQHVGNDVTCETSNTPLMVLFPDNNPHHPFGGTRACEGDRTPPSFDDLKKTWRALKGCRPPATDFLVSEEGVSCERWACHGDAPLVMCEVDGGRPWPGMKSGDIGTSCESSAPQANLARVTTEFFQALNPIPPEHVLRTED